MGLGVQGSGFIGVIVYRTYGFLDCKGLPGRVRNPKGVEPEYPQSQQCLKMMGDPNP